MSDSVRDLAALIGGGLRGGPVEALTGFVVADGGDGTVTVNVGGVDVPGVPRLTSYTPGGFGERVLVLVAAGSPWVVGKSAVA